MPEDQRRPVMTGGCQCGAVRYALYAEPFDPHICHCRMCQRAFGAFFAPLAAVRNADFAWTRGTPGLFRSSTIAERGFCAACGTPLSFRYLDARRIAVALGSLDDPDRVTPARQSGIESRVHYFADLAGLPGETTEARLPPDYRQRFVNLQSADDGKG